MSSQPLSPERSRSRVLTLIRSTLSRLLRPPRRFFCWLDGLASRVWPVESGRVRASDMPSAFGPWMPNQPNKQASTSCSECGQNMGPTPENHTCSESAFLAHQQSKWKLEIDKNAESDLQNFLASPKGQFVTWLIEQKRI